MARDRHYISFYSIRGCFLFKQLLERKVDENSLFSSERVIFQLFIRVIHPFDNEIPDITFLYALKLFFRSCFKNYIMYILYFHIVAIVFVICDMFFL